MNLDRHRIVMEGNVDYIRALHDPMKPVFPKVPEKPKAGAIRPSKNFINADFGFGTAYKLNKESGQHVLYGRVGVYSDTYGASIKIYRGEDILIAQPRINIMKLYLPQELVGFEDQYSNWWTIHFDFDEDRKEILMKYATAKLELVRVPIITVADEKDKEIAALKRKVAELEDTLEDAPINIK